MTIIPPHSQDICDFYCWCLEIPGSFVWNNRSIMVISRKQHCLEAGTQDLSCLLLLFSLSLVRFTCGDCFGKKIFAHIVGLLMLIRQFKTLWFLMFTYHLQGVGQKWINLPVQKIVYIQVYSAIPGRDPANSGTAQQPSILR